MTLSPLCLMLARRVPEGASLLCVLAALGMRLRQRSPQHPSPPACKAVACPGLDVTVDSW